MGNHETSSLPPDLVSNVLSSIGLAADPETPLGVRPLYDRVIVERMDLPSRLPSGLYVPESAQKPMLCGIVVAKGVGPDERGVPNTAACELGDIVLYTAPWQGEDFERNGKRYRVLEDYQLAAILPPGFTSLDIIHHG